MKRHVTNAVDLFGAITEGALNKNEVSFLSKASVVKYLVPASYPDSGNEHVEIDFDEKEIEKAGFSMIFASVAQKGQTMETLGSRTLAIVGLGEDVYNISEQMETLLEQIEPPTMRHRKDVGDEIVIRNKIQKMRSIRNEVS
jgi:phosphoribosylamine--glycine ligase